jgi:hypothetical protein
MAVRVNVKARSRSASREHDFFSNLVDGLRFGRDNKI